MDSINLQVFFSLLRSGLWEQPVHLSGMGDVDFDAIFQLAQEQSVVGLVAAGLELLEDRKVTKPQALPFMKHMLATENRNAGMNLFVANLFTMLRKAGIHAILVKGQGIAQCYERPQWRSAGDIDLLLDMENYEKAKSFLIPCATHLEKEYKDRMHLGMTIDSWSVELHGSLRSYRLGRVNDCIDEVLTDIFQHRRTRVWMNGETEIDLPAVDNDIIIVFTHILQHFFSVGIGLRQICDWCRLLWTYREEIDRKLLSKRLGSVRLKSEWEVLALLAVNYLGMPMGAIPLYRESTLLNSKASRFMDQILRAGNFGHNHDTQYIHTSPYLIRKYISFRKLTHNALNRMIVFPLDAMSFYVYDVVDRLKAVRLE